MRDLVQKLPSGNPQRDVGTSDDTIAAVLATLNEVIKKHPEFSRWEDKDNQDDRMTVNKLRSLWNVIWCGKAKASKLLGNRVIVDQEWHQLFFKIAALPFCGINLFCGIALFSTLPFFVIPPFFAIAWHDSASKPVAFSWAVWHICGTGACLTFCHLKSDFLWFPPFTV